MILHFSWGVFGLEMLRKKKKKDLHHFNMGTNPKIDTPVVPSYGF